MADTLSRAFIILFMMSYSVLLIVLVWSALSPRLRRAVKNMITFPMVWGVGTFGFRVWKMEERLTFKANTKSRFNGLSSRHD